MRVTVSLMLLQVVRARERIELELGQKLFLPDDEPPEDSNRHNQLNPLHPNPCVNTCYDSFIGCMFIICYKADALIIHNLY